MCGVFFACILGVLNNTENNDMPGSPLPKLTKNLENDGWPWPISDGTGWGKPITTPAPKAIFDANNKNELVGSVGFTNWNISSGQYPNEEIPFLSGERGLRVSYSAQTPFQNANGRELNYKLAIPQPHVFEYLKIAQPVNYRMPREMSFSTTSFADVEGWEAGDIIESQSVGSGYSGTLVGVQDGETRTVVITDFTGHPELNYRSDYTVYNTTKNQQAIIATAGAFESNNAKFMCLWVSDDPTLQERGYENGNFSMGVDLPTSTDNPNFSGDGISKIDGSLADAGLPTENHAGGIQNNEISGMPSRPVVFDTEDNGHIVELVVERKRSSGYEVNDGVFALWKKVSRAGSPYEQWTELFRATDIHLYSSYHDNKWTHGYLFGNKNGGYRVPTDFYIMGYQLWLEKPTFLTEAGV